MPGVNYNPDVLSCLANLSNDEVFTPPEIANAMLDMLPQELFSDPNAKFLDPACKTGVFLREIAKRLIKGLENKIPNLQERLDHIFHEQLYAIAITELTALVSRRSTYCSKKADGLYSISTFDSPDGNIRYQRTEHKWDGNGKKEDQKCTICGASRSQFDRGKELETHAYEFIHKEDIYKMKFDLIISNPPYQLETGGSKSQAIPLYNNFVETAKKLKPRFLTMIIPDRWFSGGFGLNDFREQMLTDNKLSSLTIYPLASDCFPGVDIPGGICYFLWGRENNDRFCNVSVVSKGKVSFMRRPLLEDGCDVFVKYNEGISILRKVIKDPSFSSIENILTSQRPFGLGTTFEGSSKSNTVLVYGRNQAKSYCSIDQITANTDLINQWKVFISASYGERISENFFILGKPFIGRPNTACTETYIAFCPLKNEIECHNLISYVSTKFFRFMVMLKKPTQHTLKKVYSFVPIQDFSKPWTDEELYKKYGITEEEIAFIDSMIRPMDLSGGSDA